MKVKVNTMICYFVAACFVMGSSSFLKGISGLSMIINLTVMATFALSIVKIIQRKTMIPYDIALIMLYMVLFVSTALHSKQYNTYIVYATQALGASFFIKIQVNKDIKTLVSAFRNVLFFFLFANLVLLIVFPKGFDIYNANTVYYLLGLRVAFTPFVLCGMFMAVLHDTLFNNKKISSVTLLMTSVGMLSVILETVVTGIVTVVLSVLLIWAYRKEIIHMNFQQFLIVYVVFFCAVVVFSVQYNIPVLSYFLTDLLNKDLTFNNRTTIWAAAISQFLRNPILGTGIGHGVSVQFEYRYANLAAHNQVLDLLCQGGVIAFASFLYMLRYIHKSIKKTDKVDLFQIAMPFLVAIFMLMFTEVLLTKALVFIMFAFMVYTPSNERNSCKLLN